jgi:hypothetical protein
MRKSGRKKETGEDAIYRYRLVFCLDYVHHASAWLCTPNRECSHLIGKRKRVRTGRREQRAGRIRASKQGSELCAFSLGHSPLVREVSLVGNENEGHIIVILCPHDLAPEERGLFERGAVCLSKIFLVNIITN